MSDSISRRSFLKTAAAVGAVAALPTGFTMVGCTPQGPQSAERGEADYEGLPFGADSVGFVKCGHGDVCGMYHMANAYVKDGVIVGYEGCKEAHNKGALCPRGMSGLQLMYSPQRVKYPMKTQKRGSGNWERISWDEAYETISDEIAQAIKEEGPHTVAFSTGHCMSYTCTWAVPRFWNLFGFSNGEGPSFCWANLMVGSWPALGDYTHLKEPSLAQSKLIVFWGHNPAIAMPTQWRDGMMKAKLENGAKFIVVDPYYTETAEKADLFIQIRPGTDAALALGVANVMISEDLVNHEFIDNHTVGYDDYKQLALGYSLEEISRITWASVDEIKEFAHMYAELSPAVIEMGRGGNYVSGDAGWLCSRGTTCLTGLKGDLGKPGGGYSVETSTFSPGCTSMDDWPFANYADVECVTKPTLDKNGEPISAFGSFKGTPVLYDGDPFHYRVYMTHTDVAAKLPDQDRLHEGLNNIPLIVVQNPFMNYTAQNFADIVLPCTLWAEEPMILPEYTHMVASAPAIEPMYEAKPTYLMLAELTDCICKKIDVKQPEETFFPDRTPEAIGNALLTNEELPKGGFPNITFEELAKIPEGMRGVRDYNQDEYVLYRTNGKPDGEYEFHTPSGKFEFKSDWLADEYGLPALPVYSEPIDGPVALSNQAAEYPLVANSRVHRHFGFIQWGLTSDGGHVSPVLREVFSSAHEPVIELNPATAAEHGLAEGDMIWVESLNGKTKAKLHATERCHPKMVITPYYWGGEQNRTTPHTFSLFPGINVKGVGKYGEGRTIRNRGGQAVYAGYIAKVYKA